MEDMPPAAAGNPPLDQRQPAAAGKRPLDLGTQSSLPYAAGEAREHVQSAAARAADVARGLLHGEPPVDETFKCLCERCKVSAQLHGALFNCRWNRNALGKLRCGLFSFLLASVFVRTTAVEHVSFVLSLTSLTSLTSP